MGRTGTTTGFPKSRLTIERHRHGWSQQDVADLVETTPLSLRSTIARSAQWVDAPARRALYLLSFFSPKPADFSEEEVLAKCHILVETLDVLTDAGLLESTSPGRYTLHPTIADYASLYCTE